MMMRVLLRSVVLFSLWALTASGCSDDSTAVGVDGGGGGADKGGTTPVQDKDKDGYTTAQGDCDDGDPKIYPGAKEICDDNKDNNCNGAKDSYEPDGDFDGFGPCQGDCDDRDQAVSPAVKEIPDGKDNNCDGIIDGDYDGDGHTTAQGDCDDNNALVYPKAPEDCYDGKDNDCNKYIDDKEPDKDKDGYGPCAGDCDDANPKINPGVKEIAGDKIDNNCDSMIDADIDGDGWTTENGDCNDGDPKIHPGAKVSCTSAADLNCNKIPDNQEKVDMDNDGMTACEGDCDDYDATRRPGFIEFPGDKIDNDCDGKVDNVPPCDCAALPDEAQAMDFCTAGVTITRGGNPLSIAIRQSAFGAIKPRLGCGFVTLSTGNAWSAKPQPGNNMGTTGNPVTVTGCMACTIPGSSKWIHPGPNGCCEKAKENDTAWLRVEAKAPVNAKGIKFDFIFLSSEYPEYVHSPYNDTFYAVVSNPALSKVQNVSFDLKGQPLTVNNGWFEKPSSPTQSIAGTGYQGGVGSSSGWLTTTVPVKPETKVSITFWIHDESDHILDSAVIIDKLHWVSTTVTGPSTIK